uniref:Uncharacterized protein n=1 Tax=Geladintestivirus 5 TaxID=3233137 RepID=A0AAU8ML13_9CAUD
MLPIALSVGLFFSMLISYPHLIKSALKSIKIILN